MGLSREQSERDKREAVTARRAAAELPRGSEANIEQAIRKLKYNKSDSIIFELKRIADDMKEQRETLEDPEYDPD